jgi:hypothetical protein
MMERKTKRGPAVAAAGTSLSAVGATVQSTYFRSGYQSKEIDLVTVPRVWIADAIELLIDSLDYADTQPMRHNGREDSL